MHSYYTHTLTTPFVSAPLPAQLDVKVAIVGAGYAGLNTGLSLLERGVKDVAVLDAHQVGFGASGRNGGFVFGGYSLGESQLLAKLGPAAAKAWYLRTTGAVNLIRQRIQQHAIDCDFVDAGVLWANWFTSEKILRARQQLLAKHFDTHWEFISGSALHQQLATRRYSAALFERNACAMHPLKYANGLARAIAAGGGAVYQHAPVLAIKPLAQGFELRTAAGKIHCEQVVIACGGYLGNLQATLARALMPIATYVMTTEALGARMAALMQSQASVYDSRFAFDYYRPLPDTRLLWGGRISVRDAPPKWVAAQLKKDLMKVFPQLKDVAIDFAWSGLMSYARHEMPQIGQLQKGLWYAQAFGGHGVAPTCVAGEVLAAAISEGDQHYQELAEFGLSNTFGIAGKMAAQSTYSWLQARDWLSEKLGPQIG
jgi:gamma-glutamylputrescine oxidase